MRDETRISRSRLVSFLRDETRTRRASSKRDENEKSYFSSRSRYFSFSYENFSFCSRFVFTRRDENEKHLQKARREREELFLVSFSSRCNTISEGIWRLLALARSHILRRGHRARLQSLLRRGCHNNCTAYIHTGPRTDGQSLHIRLLVCTDARSLKRVRVFKIGLPRSQFAWVPPSVSQNKYK